MNNFYLEVISLVERLHRQFLEVVKLELEGLRVHDINNVQAMMLFNIGDAEMTVGELTLRGCYLGSNVSYNVKKMVENGYLAHERSVHDRRSIHVRLTEKGGKLRPPLGRHASAPRPDAFAGDAYRRRSAEYQRYAAQAGTLLDPRCRLGSASTATVRGGRGRDATPFRREPQPR